MTTRFLAFFFCESSLFRTNHSTLQKGACSTQRQRGAPLVPGTPAGVVSKLVIKVTPVTGLDDFEQPNNNMYPGTPACDCQLGVRE